MTLNDQCSSHTILSQLKEMRIGTQNPFPCIKLCALTSSIMDHVTND